MIAPAAPSSRMGAYRGAMDSNRRRRVYSALGNEDHHLGRRDRRKLLATTHDARRNFAAFAWCIRKHIDYVASFHFQARTDDEGLNTELEALVAEVSRPARFDAAGRHGLHRSLRLIESTRTIGGDCLPLKHADGSVQFIEPDRIDVPAGADLRGVNDLDTYVNGVKVDRRGRHLKYAVCDRDGSGLKLTRVLPARYFFDPIGYYDRFDQVRGVSPLAAGLNPSRDADEGFELALSKLKMLQYLAVVLNRSADTSMGELAQGQDADGNDVRSEVSVDLGEGPQLLDLDEGESASFLTADTPGANAREFLQDTIALFLKSLDIPYSFYDEAHTNFYGSRGGLQQYVKSCRAKRADLRHFLDEWTRWRIARAIDAGELSLAGRDVYGHHPRAIKFEWAADAVPWWDPSKEIDGHLKAINAGLDSPQRVARDVTGTDWFDNIELRAQAQDFARKRGVVVSFTPSNQKGTSTENASQDSDDE